MTRTMMQANGRVPIPMCTSKCRQSSMVNELSTPLYRSIRPRHVCHLRQYPSSCESNFKGQSRYLKTGWKGQHGKHLRIEFVPILCQNLNSRIKLDLSLHEPWLFSGGVGVAIPAAAGIIVAAGAGSSTTCAVIATGASSAGGSTADIVMTRGTSGRRTSSQSTANTSWLTLKSIIALFTAGQTSTLLLEVSHADSGQSRCRVMLRFVLVNLMNGNSGVDD